MAEQVKSLMGRLSGAVQGFSLAQRTLALIGVAVLVLGGVALSSWMARPTLTPLFSGLSGTDASAVVEQLNAAGVPYELGDGGSTVLVPAEAVYEQRIAMAAAGLPADADGAGYSLLDSMPMTASEFQQQTTYQRAMEGELARTVGAIDGVETATVKLAIPEETVFVEEQQTPTASVFVRTRAGQTLTADQVQSIVHLVSAGVDGMEPTDVAVIDSTGAVLSAVGEGVTAGLADSKTAEYEERTRLAVQAMLDPLVGVGNATVNVSAELDTATTERTTEEFSQPEDVPPLASSTTVEEYEGTGGSATGVLGPDNIAVPDGAAGGTGTYRTESEDVTNSINKTTEVTQQPAGVVQRQSVSVLIDEVAGAAVDMPALEAAVAAAVGIDTARGDQLSVQRLQFDTATAQAAEEALAAAEAAEAAAAQQDLIRQGAIGGLVLLAVIIIAIVLARRSRKARREAVDLGQLDAAAALPVVPLDGPSEDALPVLPPAPEPVVPDTAAIKRAELTALADDDPGEVADLLRGWMTPTGRR